MFARNISIHLKSNMLSDYTRTFEKDVMPLLRKQNGFKDEITFAGPGGVDVTAISHLGKQERRRHLQHQYVSAGILKTLARFIEGTPQVHTFDVVSSTIHKHAVLAVEGHSVLIGARRRRYCRLLGLPTGTHSIATKDDNYAPGVSKRGNDQSPGRTRRIPSQEIP